MLIDTSSQYKNIKSFVKGKQSVDSRQDEPFYGLVDASADPKNRVGGCLHGPQTGVQFWVGGGLHGLCLLGRRMQKIKRELGSVEATADPRNTIHPADCPMIVRVERNEQ